jgi:phosphatidylserine/phosphatidylglycerophosphate/cardiolipin synthase-like enzyme
VKVRVLLGDPFPFSFSPRPIDIAAFLRALTAGLDQARPGLVVYAAWFGMGRGLKPPSWNHAKIVAADGRRALVGGHNLYLEGDYFGPRPVFDLSLELMGPAAASAHAFAGALWRYAAGSAELRPRVIECLEWRPGSGAGPRLPGAGETSAGERAPRAALEARFPPASLALPRSPGGAAGKPGAVSVLAVADPGRGVHSMLEALEADRPGIFAERAVSPSERAAEYFFEGAEEEILISQQDLYLLWGANPRVIGALARFLSRSRGRLAIVLSGRGVFHYSSGALSDVAGALREALLRTPGAPSGAALAALLSENVLITTLRFNASEDAWPDGADIGNHAKAWMVDRRVFYIGSHNLYPVQLEASGVESLPEFGYVVDDRGAAARLYAEYFGPLIGYSARAGVSGRAFGAPVLPGLWG